MIDFSDGQESPATAYIRNASKKHSIPLEIVLLAGEHHAKKVWETNLVLIRPDGFVSWHGNTIEDQNSADWILSKATGYGGGNNERNPINS